MQIFTVKTTRAGLPHLANLLESDYEIYMARLLAATVNWHKLLQFIKSLT